MDKNALWKWLILIFVVAFSLVLVTPYKTKIRLGLDLQGGSSFTVQIDKEQTRKDIIARSPSISTNELEEEVSNALKGAQDRALEVLRNRIDQLGINEPVVTAAKEDRILIQLPGVSEEKRREAKTSIQSAAYLEFRLVHKKNTELVASLFDKRLAPPGYIAAEDGFYKELDRQSYTNARDQAYLLELGKFNVPDAEYEFMLEKVERDGRNVYRPCFVKRRPEMSGEHLKNASVGYGGAINQPQVEIAFDAKGAKKFSQVTSDYAPRGAKNMNSDVGRQLAIVLDGKLYSAPYIKQAIFGGSAEITGSFSLREAALLANIMKAGSLPAPVKIIEERSVEPTLGKDSIQSGVKATVLAAVFVMLFMAVYYLAAGIVADLALILNFVLLPLGMWAVAGFMSLGIGSSLTSGRIELPVLTLPGIAGIALTLGMAVDANVLVFERIREELKSGKTLWTAVSAGYERAFLAIFDSNLTTILTGVILFWFGSGPIRGYAITLCAGLIISMYTALTVTKLFFGLMASRTQMKTLKMLSFVKTTSIDFISMYKPALALSLVVIIGSFALMIMRGMKDPGLVLGVDFTGGSSVTLSFNARQPVENVRSALESAGIQQLRIQYQKEAEVNGSEFLRIETGAQTKAVETGNDAGEIITDRIVKVLQEKFPDSAFSITQKDDVGPQIGKELKRSSMIAFGLALLIMIIYLSIRFEFSFALGAVVALAHDVLITMGLYSLFGRQMNLAIVAALLTIVGYSVNDTIVIFDRIREDLKLIKNKTFKEICNLSINQTLSRTILTSFTVFISVLMLLIFGGGEINDFALCMFIGVVVGTYSTVFIATPIVLMFHRGRRPDMDTK